MTANRKMIETLFDELRQIMSCLGKLLKNPANIELFKDVYSEKSPVDSLNDEDTLNFLLIAKTFTSGRDFMKGTPFELIAKNVPAIIDVLINKHKNKGQTDVPRLGNVPTVYEE